MAEGSPLLRPVFGKPGFPKAKKISACPPLADQPTLLILPPFGLQVKIMTDKELLAVACEQFLGKNVQDIKNVVLQTLEGHLRSILGAYRQVGKWLNGGQEPMGQARPGDLGWEMSVAILGRYPGHGWPEDAFSDR